LRRVQLARSCAMGGEDVLKEVKGVESRYILFIGIRTLREQIYADAPWTLEYILFIGIKYAV